MIGALCEIDEYACGIDQLKTAEPKQKEVYTHSFGTGNDAQKEIICIHNDREKAIFGQKNNTHKMSQYLNVSGDGDDVSVFLFRLDIIIFLLFRTSAAAKMKVTHAYSYEGRTEIELEYCSRNCE